MELDKRIPVTVSQLWKALSLVEFHEAFSDLASAKYGSLDMPSLLNVYDQIRSRDLPTAYRFAIAMQDFALSPTAQLYSERLSKDSLPKRVFVDFRDETQGSFSSRNECVLYSLDKQWILPSSVPR